MHTSPAPASPATPAGRIADREVTPADAALLTDAALLDEWVELSRQIAALEARRAEILHERMERLAAASPGAAVGGGSVSFRSMVSEFAAAGHVPPATMEGEFGAAWSLVERYPAVLASLRRGTISRRHADTIVAAGTVIPFDDDRRRDEYTRRALPFAESETVARTRAHTRSLVASLVPATVTERHRRARDDRGVQVLPLDDGMAELRAVLPEILARAIHDRLTGIARHVAAVHRTAGSGHEDAASLPTAAGARGLDHIRADVLADLLLTAAPASVDRTALDAITATVQVTLAASTLAGEDDRPAEHDGHGPLDPAVARLLAGGATTWTRLFLDPAGQVVQTDGYSPTASMRRHLRARDRHCRFPGCRVPARRCDIDHNHDHARGGPTRIGNLSLFCRRHHTLKHPDLDDGDRWSVEQLSGGRLRWRSPLGRTYEDTPPPRVMFG